MTLRSIFAAATAFMVGYSPVFADDWTGIYAGLSIGTATSNDTWTNTGSPDFFDAGSGGLLGVQVGYNHQLRHVVFGIEGDYLASGVKGNISCPDPSLECGHKIKDLGSVRARIGWLGTPTAMIYLTGGLGWAATEWKQQDAITGSTLLGGASSHSSSGLVLGTGAEFLLVNHLSLKGEYLHYNLGTFTPAAADFAGTPPTLKLYADTFKLGLNFRY